MTNFVQYVEPNKDGKPRTFTISRNEAIQRSKSAAEKHGYTYTTDSEALADFLVVHWGYLIDFPLYELNEDQPTTCPICGVRTEFEELSPTQQLHTCLNSTCGHKFITEHAA